MENSFKNWCKENAIRITEIKPIQYGTQFKLNWMSHKASVGIYHSGKALVQGKEGPLKDKLNHFFGKEPSASANTKKPVPSSDPNLQHEKKFWIGVDESGKGDFFGPLVTCGVVVTKTLEAQLLSLGVKDSKKLSDARVKEMAPQLMGKLHYHCITLMPNEYNDEYQEINNLNHMLAMQHRNCIKELYDERIELIISDQFASDKTLLESYIDQAGIPTDKLLQAPRAEEDLAVACASIIARYKFIESIKTLSHNYGTNFPKGAGPAVDETAKDFALSFGIEHMDQVAKVHFKTFERLFENGTEE